MQPPVSSTFVRTIDEALQYLTTALERSDSDKPLPHFILSDLRLGLESGFTLIKSIRSKGRISHLPVIIISGSQAENSLREAYSIGANAVVEKPTALRDLETVLETVCQFWCATAKLPSSP